MAGNLTAMIASIFSGSAVSTDPYFNLTTLLLSTTATNGQQNNTFLDSSTNNFTITRNPATGPNAPTQGTLSPFSQTGWSGSFGNSSSWITTNTTAFSNTASTWTIEAWVYMNALPASDPPPMFGDMQAGGTTNYLSFGPDLNGKLQLYWFDGATKTAVGNTVMSLSTWNHVAISVNAGAISLFVNGTLQTITGTSTLTNRTGTTGANAISRSYTAFFNGYISNLRVTTTAVYSGSFTPSTTPLTAITGTQLLLFTGNRFVDANTQTTPKTLTITTNSGYPAVVPFSPFNPTGAWSASTVGGSGYFDGTGDYLNTPATGQFAPAGNFSIRLWFYLTSLAATNHLIGNYTANAATDWLVEVINTGVLQVFTNGSTLRLSHSGITTNQWYYLTLTRSGTTITGQINGSNFNVTATYTQSGTFGSATKSIYIGQRAGSTNPLFGYLSSVSLVDGSALQTVPTAPLTNETGTQLLLNFTNSGIYDATAKNVLETVGNAQVSTAQSKWPSTSMSFNGTTDYLQVNTASDLYNLSSGNWTIEAWVYRTSTATNKSGIITYLDNSTSSLSGWVFDCGASNAGQLGFYSYNLGTLGTNVSSSAGAVPINTWTYVAATCVGSTITIYINGTSVASGTKGGWTTNANCRLRIGGWNWSVALRYWQGYIQDPRITKGYARTIATPTAAFPVQ